MTTLEIASRLPLGLNFSLDDYTDWYNSPRAAILFWAVFGVIVLVIVALTLWAFGRRARR
jgi:hypothetical protein